MFDTSTPLPSVREPSFFVRRDFYDAANRIAPHLPYERMSVTALCSEAGKSRATFYRQFTSKANVSQRLWEDLAYGWTTEVGGATSWEQGLAGLVQGVAGYGSFLRKVMGSSDQTALYEVASSIRSKAFCKAIGQNLGASCDEDPQLLFEIEALSHAETHIILQWLAEGMPDDPADFVAYLKSLAPQHLYRTCEGNRQSHGMDARTRIPSTTHVRQPRVSAEIMPGTSAQTITSREYSRRMACVRALQDLLASSKMSDVTAADVYQAAGMSKSTFYRLFPNLMAVPVWHFSFRLGAFSSSLGLSTDWRQSCLAVAEGFAADEPLYRATFEYSGYDSFVHYATKLLQSNLSNALFVRRGIKRTRKLEIQIEYASFVTTSMTSKWLTDGMPYPSEQLADYLEQVVPRELYDLVGKTSVE